MTCRVDSRCEVTKLIDSVAEAAQATDTECNKTTQTLVLHAASKLPPFKLAPASILCSDRFPTCMVQTHILS